MYLYMNVRDVTQVLPVLMVSTIYRLAMAKYLRLSTVLQGGFYSYMWLRSRIVSKTIRHMRSHMCFNDVVLCWLFQFR